MSCIKESTSTDRKHPLSEPLPSYDSATGLKMSALSLPRGATTKSTSGAFSSPGTTQQAYLCSAPPNAVTLPTFLTWTDPPYVVRKHQNKGLCTGSGELLLERIDLVTTYDRRDPMSLYNFLIRKAMSKPCVILRFKGGSADTCDSFIIIDGPAAYCGVQLSVLPCPPRGPVPQGWASGLRSVFQSYQGYNQLAIDDTAGSGPTHSSYALGPRGNFTDWDKARWGQGYPIWARFSDVPYTGETPVVGEVDIERGDMAVDRDLMDWCKAYCADKGWLKEFKLRREVWGWDFDSLIKSVKDVMISTGNVTVDMSVTVEWDVAETIKFVHFLLQITFIYQLVMWLHSLGLIPGGGGTYDVARATHDLDPYNPLPSTYPGEALESARARMLDVTVAHPEVAATAKLQVGPEGVHYQANRNGADWLEEWKGDIRRVALQGGRLMLRRQSERTHARDVGEYYLPSAGIWAVPMKVNYGREGNSSTS